MEDELRHTTPYVEVEQVKASLTLLYSTFAPSILNHSVLLDSLLQISRIELPVYFSDRKTRRHIATSYYWAYLHALTGNCSGTLNRKITSPESYPGTAEAPPPLPKRDGKTPSPPKEERKGATSYHTIPICLGTFTRQKKEKPPHNYHQLSLLPLLLGIISFFLFFNSTALL
jgi:hypothetical protein